MIDEEFKSMKEMTERAFAAFDGMSECERFFLEFVAHSHHSQHFHIERKAFCAGWAAAMRQRWKEQND
jgi:hypothetical protein